MTEREAFQYYIDHSYTTQVDFLEVMRHFMFDQKKTKTDLGKFCGLSKQQITNYFSGQSHLSLPMAFFFCHYIGYDFRYVIEVLAEQYPDNIKQSIGYLTVHPVSGMTIL